MVATQYKCGVPITPSSKDISIVYFIRLNPPTFTGVKVEDDPQGFLDEIKKDFLSYACHEHGRCGVFCLPTERCGIPMVQ